MSKFTRVKNLSPWRKLALTFWDKPSDPTVYGWYDFDVTIAQAYLDKINKKSAAKVTLTHYVAKAMGLLIADYPIINGIIKWGQIYLRDSVDLFVQVAIKESKGRGDQLSGAKITGLDKKSLIEIAQELSRTAHDIRNDKDPQFQKQFTLTKYVPICILKHLIKVNGFLTFNLGLSFPSLGINADPFGSAMLTSVGSLDTPPGLAPIVPPSRCPFLVCIGRVEKKPWVVNDRVEVRPVMTYTVTFDHRFMDGLTGSKMFKSFMEILYNPEKYF